jgi:hypothetical protein
MKITRKRPRSMRGRVAEPVREEQAGAASPGVRDREPRHERRETRFSDRLREQLRSNPRGGTWKV